MAIGATPWPRSPNGGTDAAPPNAGRSAAGLVAKIAAQAPAQGAQERVRRGRSRPARRGEQREVCA
eukprot:1866785-Pyramimonas_sp.AAC.1